ncbi:MAG: hypothetical protein IKI35_03320, partial [Stomatobaculum sp.]|nr:hypothetical protein [Stomatobaculum sp.]
GTIKHPELEVTENAWYTSIPTVLPTTTVENDTINQYTELSANGRFSQNKGGENSYVNIIAKGFTEEGMNSAEQAAEKVAGDFGGAQYLALKQNAWDRLLTYYNSLAK